MMLCDCAQYPNMHDAAGVCVNWGSHVTNPCAHGYIVEPGQIDYGSATFAVTDNFGNIVAVCHREDMAEQIAATLTRRLK